MVIFHEYFPVKKDAITSYVKMQILAEGLTEIGGGDADDLGDKCGEDNKESSEAVGLSSEMAEKFDSALIELAECVDFDRIFINTQADSPLSDSRRFDIAATESFLSFTGSVSDVAKQANVKSINSQHAEEKISETKRKTFGAKKSASTPVISQKKSVSFLSAAKKSMKDTRLVKTPKEPFKSFKERRNEKPNEIKIPVVDLKLTFNRQ